MIRADMNLTLSIDERVAEQARRPAKAMDKSLKTIKRAPAR